jgi:membrane-associated protein
VIEFLNHLNGTPAALLLCALLFIDELGVPLPFAPNEVLLLVGGLLVGSGALVAWVFLPLAFLATVAGMLTGYGWAHALGSDRLRSLAQRVDAEKKYSRAVSRLQSAGPARIALARLTPGVRVYATLVAGASGVALRRFLLGGVPALAAWVVAFTAIGDLVGRPAEGLISRVDGIVLTGALSIALAFGAVLVIRHVPRAAIDDNQLAGVPERWRLLLALAVDLGIVGSVITGIVGVGGRFFPILTQVDAIIVVAIVVVITYVLAARRGAGATLGEGLYILDFASMIKRLRGRGGPQRGATSDAAVAHGRALAGRRQGRPSRGGHR